MAWWHKACMPPIVNYYTGGSNFLYWLHTWHCQLYTEMESVTVLFDTDYMLLLLIYSILPQLSSRLPAPSPAEQLRCYSNTHRCLVTIVSNRNRPTAICKKGYFGVSCSIWVTRQRPCVPVICVTAEILQYEYKRDTADYFLPRKRGRHHWCISVHGRRWCLHARTVVWQLSI